MIAWTRRIPPTFTCVIVCQISYKAPEAIFTRSHIPFTFKGSLESRQGPKEKRFFSSITIALKINAINDETGPFFFFRKKFENIFDPIYENDLKMFFY